MPIKMGKKTYKKFSSAAAAVAKKKGISKDRANAYVATVERTIAKRRKAKRKTTSKRKKKKS